MRILVAHSRYLSGDASGENRVVDEEVALLRGAGHTVFEWQPTPDVANGAALVRQGLDAIWSGSAVRTVSRAIREKHPDVVHVHNLYPTLSPAVVRAAASHGVAVVMTLHNYRMLCLPATLLRDGKICEDCVGRVPWRGVAHACYRRSRPASAVVAASISFHRALRSLDAVTAFLAVGEFVKRKHVEAGWNADRIWVKSNFVAQSARRRGPGGAFLYVGRLSAEKGLDPLFRLWPADAPLHVVGDGPERASLERIAPSSVRFHGAVAADEVAGFMVRARALVLPSVCYEGQPRAILEAFAAGVPVVASALGGMVDLVEDGMTGFLARPGERDGWHRALDALRADPTSTAMGDAALERWSSMYSPEKGLQDLENAYEGAVALARARSRRSLIHRP
jgi:glycosyltransferase involved in cell wall biosynthesis